jgi:hypothetical protein
MSKLPYRVPTLRGANHVRAMSESETSEDGLRRITGRYQKRSIGDRRYDIVRCFTLKERVEGKWVVIDIQRDETEARRFLKKGTR